MGEGRGSNEKKMIREMRGEIDPEISRWIYKGKKETKMKNETMLESEGEREADSERKMYVHVKEKVC